MGKIVEKTKRKKKGRPSLIDLQKRTLKEQQQQEQHQHKQIQTRNLPISNNSPLRPSLNYNSATPTSLRRSSRRNPNTSSPDIQSQQDEDDDDEEEEDDAAAELNGKRREKKLKLVLKLPSNKKLETDSASLNSNASASNGEEDKTSLSYHRKRKINAISDGSGFGASQKREKSVSGANPTNNAQDWGPSTPLPDKKLLLFILDRLQKKDTHGVFSEPVDPDELPDYHEVIANPMDFGTLRKKLSSGAYATLEQFEKDVFLISSNAMQYNAPDTIYFRQARSIQELAKKSFENLRQDSDDNEPEMKVVRRGRPPTKNLKKPLGRPSLAQAHPDFSFDATLTSGGENTLWSNNDLRKGPIISDKSNFGDLSGQSHGSRIDAHWSADNKFEKNSEATGSMFKGGSFKNGKKQFVIDENRRNTYKQFSASGREPSVLATFDAERKQLVAVGLLSEHGYARSLARFAANIGTVAWKIASTRIERSLPPGVKFGHGWVGENDIPPQKPLLLSSSPPGPLSSSQPLSLPENSCNAETSSVAESKEKPSKQPENNMRENDMPTTQSAAEGQLSTALSPSASTSSSASGANKSETHLENAAAVEGLNSNSMMRPRPPFQIHQSGVVHPGMNGFNGTYGFHMPAQMGKLVEAARSAGFNFQSLPQNDRVSRTNSSFFQGSQNPNPKASDNSMDAIGNSEKEEVGPTRCGIERQSSWQGLSGQLKPDSDSVPPDLNVIFQSPGSPSCSRVESGQPDLALQL
ncbi:uncharacterized protein [Euphorbia lathyris]|uniref:uncharacterized protein n=1 Tax=Euphorbia lathyris TaxID=212925 RepID=UPI00331396BB